MANKELGTKRVDPETGKKFYDLNRDPIVSPYTGISYPRSYFEVVAAEANSEEDADTEELDTVEKSAFMLLEEGVDDSKDDDIPDLVDEDVDLGDDEDTFLSHDENDEDDDMTDILGNSVLSDDNV
ncbi:TIGR02300 family protein [Bartonella bacilliformis str. Heidi Mejia]|uniref:TIGR02300 family protein n=1 Tax=Bartonella bacilliformis TaxID=774 RepID=UPI0004500A90|nr:TIGR02300 family protein [Bartonella bacilliformis]EYS90893.1 TIGR02300 family protein [Bartonella bacilliformis str. Heidi Mejia]KEG17190.1 TIGR02300 family protein [Bartonella bacilliformis Hosp800-02]KEG21914.1 TIGR02300 family protein [Bartonella bacilliformis VAB9028]KEG23289.1 TIGR02300 family protein [Bartonella bacilliformis CAR600-02]